MSTFAAATAVRALEPGRYGVDIDPGWASGARPNGGYVLAAAARAALAAGQAAGSDHPHPVITTAHFLSPPDDGPAEVDTEVLRTGRTATTVRFTLRQGASVRIVGHLTAGRLAGHSPEWQRDPAPPALRPEAECAASSSQTPMGSISLLDQVRVSMDPDHLGWAIGRPSGRLEMLAWMSPAEGVLDDPLFALVAVDAMPPTPWDLRPVGWTPTVELTAHLRAIPAPGALRVRAQATLVADGWFDEDAEVWDSAGRLVARSRQLCRIQEASA